MNQKFPLIFLLLILNALITFSKLKANTIAPISNVLQINELKKNSLQPFFQVGVNYQNLLIRKQSGNRADQFSNILSPSIGIGTRLSSIDKFDKLSLDFSLELLSSENRIWLIK